MSAESNRQTVLHYFKNGAGANAALIDSVTTDDCRWWSPESGSVGKAQFKSQVATSKPNMPGGPTFVVVGTAAEGDRVAAEVRGSSKLADGRTYENSYHSLFRFRDDRICEIKRYLDTRYAAEFMKGNAIAAPVLPLTVQDQASSADTEKSRATAIAYLTSMAVHNGPNESLITDDFQTWASTVGVLNTRQFKELIVSLSGLLPQMPKMTIVGVTAEGSRVAVEARGVADLADGRRYENDYHFLLGFKNGRVCIINEYMDTQRAYALFDDGSASADL